MRLGEVYKFQDIRYFSGWVKIDDTSITLLEHEIKHIRTAYEIMKKQEQGARR